MYCNLWKEGFYYTIDLCMWLQVSSQVLTTFFCLFWRIQLFHSIQSLQRIAIATWKVMIFLLVVGFILHIKLHSLDFILCEISTCFFNKSLSKKFCIAAVDHQVIFIIIFWLAEDAPIWIKTKIWNFLLYDLHCVYTTMHQWPNKKLTFFRNVKFSKIIVMDFFEAFN